PAGHHDRGRLARPRRGGRDLQSGSTARERAAARGVHGEEDRPQSDPQLLRPGEAGADVMTWLTELLDQYGDSIVEALAETGYMMLVSLGAAVLLGLPLGMIVFLTQRGGIAEL